MADNTSKAVCTRGLWPNSTLCPMVLQCKTTYCTETHTSTSQLILQEPLRFWIYYIINYLVYTRNKVIIWLTAWQISFNRPSNTCEPLANGQLYLLVNSALDISYVLGKDQIPNIYLCYFFGRPFWNKVCVFRWQSSWRKYLLTVNTILNRNCNSFLFLSFSFIFFLRMIISFSLFSV